MGGQSVIVLDTHALVWWVDDASKLSRKARQALRVHARRRELIVSAITVFEIVTLQRRGRLQFKRPLREWLADLRKLPEIRQPFRSEEHTSELQSRVDLVCRLLLEKKKHRQHDTRHANSPRTLSSYS